jgi:glycosyltransferase involved in cell wall biosynthesis
MRIWLLTIGEPVPLHGDSRERLHRTGFFADFLSEQGHDVVWWTSTFDHWKKIHHFPADAMVQRNEHLTIRLLNGGGYGSNVSIARCRDHRRIAERFTALAEFEHKPDIIVSALPTVELCSAAVDYGRRHSCPVVVDARDMWPDIFVEIFPGFLKPVAHLLFASFFREARTVSSSATAVIGITDAFIDWELEHSGRKKSSYDREFPFAYGSSSPPADRITEAEIFWDENNIPAKSTDPIGICISTVSRMGDFDTIIRSARLLKQRGDRTRFIICGDGDKLEYYRNQTRDDGNIKFIGWADAATLYVLLRRATFGIDPLPERFDFLATINNKAIEYMSAGVPVISSPNRGVLADLLRSRGCGLSYDHGKPEQLAECILHVNENADIHSAMSRNAALVFNEKFIAGNVYKALMAHVEHIAEDFSGNRIPAPEFLEKKKQ